MSAQDRPVLVGAGPAGRLSVDALPAGRTTHVGRPIRLVLSDDGAATLEETA